MTKTIYIDWEDRRVLTEEEYTTFIARMLKEFQESCEKLVTQKLSYYGIEKFEIEV